VGTVAEGVADDRAARPLNPDYIHHIQDVDHVQEPDELRATARQGQGDTSIRSAPVSVQKDVRTGDIDKRAATRSTTRTRHGVPVSRVPHCLPDLNHP
jgi:hypothetical protein